MSDMFIWQILRLFLLCLVIQEIFALEIHCESTNKCRCNVIKLIPRGFSGYAADCSNLTLTSVPRFYANVSSINLSHNYLSLFPAKKFPENVSHIDVSWNEINEIQKDSFKGLSRLKSLDLSNNKLELNDKTYFPGVFKGLKKLKYLNLKNNTKLNSEVKPSYPREVKYLKTLEALLIDGIVDEFGDQFSELKNLKELDMSGLTGKCSIPYLKYNHFKNLPTLEQLNISDCTILRIDNGTFRDLEKLRHLDISFNEDLTFRVLSNVTYDLQFTKIRVLKATKIHYTFGTTTELYVEDIKYLNNTNIQEFNLDSNRLAVIQAGAMDCVPPTLKYVSAADNHLSMGMYVLKTSHLGVIKGNFSYQQTAHNPSEFFRQINKPSQSCDQGKCNNCEEYNSSLLNDKMQQNINKYLIFRNLNNSICKFQNGTEITFRHLTKMISILEIQCFSKVVLIAVSLAAILVSVVVITGGLVYRYRWKLRYLYYMTKKKYHGYSPVNNSIRNEQFDYDAFVSYADDDRQFVTNHMIQNLEKNGCRLCIHHRDFIPGFDIAANITNAIHKSNKTIVILSPSFLNSYWCMFEFNMARMESIYSRDGTNILFLVILEKIPGKDLPLIMMELIDSQSYIEYPNDPHGNVVFWEKIKDALC